MSHGNATGGPHRHHMNGKNQIGRLIPQPLPPPDFQPPSCTGVETSMAGSDVAALIQSGPAINKQGAGLKQSFPNKDWEPARHITSVIPILAMNC